MAAAGALPPLPRAGDGLEPDEPPGQDRLGPGATGFVRETWAPQLAVLVVVVAVLVLRHRRGLRGSYPVPRRHPSYDPVPMLLAWGSLANLLWLRAIDALSIDQRETLRAAYAATLLKRQNHRPGFDQVFDLYFPLLMGDGHPQDRIVPNEQHLLADSEGAERSGLSGSDDLVGPTAPRRWPTCSGCAPAGPADWRSRWCVSAWRASSSFHWRSPLASRRCG